MTEKELTVNKEDTRITRERRVETWLSPAVDIYEDEEALTLFADLPGVPRDRLNLGIEKGILTVEALAPAEENGSVFREFKTTGYYRRFQLPESLEFDKVSAELKDGVLTLRLPKAAAARPRKIEVTVH
ncbi:MAG: Hsp20/alpha crystallin family protein [Desulfuromonadales bacterium]|jgi:HSP20 family protein